MTVLDWPVRSIDELCERVTSGGTPSRRNPDFFRGDIPWIKTGELRDGYVSEYSEWITDDAVAASSAKLLPRETVLMGMYGGPPSVGALGMLSEPATCNQASCAMIPDRAVCEPRWLMYALLNDRARIVSLATGAAQQNLSAKLIRSFEYRTPPRHEQRAIAKVLGALDDQIAANTRLASKFEAVAVATAALSAERRPLTSVAVLTRVQVDPSALGDAEVRHFSLPAFDHGRLPSIERASTIKSNKYAIDRPCVLVSKLNPRFPRVWHVGALADGRSSIASTEFLVLQSAATPTTVLWALLANPEFSRSLESKVAGTSGSHQRVKPADILAQAVADPSALSECNIALIDASVRSADISREQNRTLAALRDALLPELMSGRLRVKDAERAVEAAL